MKRHKIDRSNSKRSFTKHAVKTHKKNVLPPSRVAMRGGIRM